MAQIDSSRCRCETAEMITINEVYTRYREAQMTADKLKQDYKLLVKELMISLFKRVNETVDTIVEEHRAQVASQRQDRQE